MDRATAIQMFFWSIIGSAKPYQRERWITDVITACAAQDVWRSAALE